VAGHGRIAEAPGNLILGSLGRIHDDLEIVYHVRPRSLDHGVQHFVEVCDTAGLRPREICTLDLSPGHFRDYKWDCCTHYHYWLALADHYEDLAEAGIAADALVHPDTDQVDTANRLLGVDFSPMV